MMSPVPIREMYVNRILTKASKCRCIGSRLQSYMRDMSSQGPIKGLWGSKKMSTESSVPVTKADFMLNITGIKK